MHYKEYYQKYYQKYLQSSEWKIIRKQILERDKNSCRKCGLGGVRLEVHHISYPKVLGTEDHSTLITLCSKCHAMQHGKKRKNKKLKQPRKEKSVKPFPYLYEPHIKTEYELREKVVVQRCGRKKRKEKAK